MAEDNQFADLISEIISRYKADNGMLIPMMQDIQADCGYLPQGHLKLLAKELGIPLSRVYSAATFYSSFRLAPRGEHEITLCMGTVCYLKGAEKISDAICREFNIKPGDTTKDSLFTLQAVNCLGACALSPVMIVDGRYYSAVSPFKALKIIHDLASLKGDKIKKGKT